MRIDMPIAEVLDSVSIPAYLNQPTNKQSIGNGSEKQKRVKLGNGKEIKTSASN